MGNKKYILILIAVLALFLISFIDSIIGYVSYSDIEKNTDIRTTFESLIKGKKEILLDLNQGNSCYWIRNTLNETNYLIEITEYETSADIKGCTGVPKKREYIVMDKPINLQGNDCVCGDLDYLLELTDMTKTKQLKVSKAPASAQGVSLGVTEFIQNLLKIFTQK